MSDRELSNLMDNQSINSIMNKDDVSINSIMNMNNHPNQNQNVDNLIEIEQKNIHMLILQRSLYILKKKIEINKKDIELLFDKYKDEKFKKIKCIKTDSLLEVLKELLDIGQFSMISYINFNELLSADLMTELNKNNETNVLKNLVKFTLYNLEKYNKIFFEKKMKKKKIQKEKELKKKPSLKKEKEDKKKKKNKKKKN